MTREPGATTWDADALSAALGVRVVIHPVVGSTMDAARKDPAPAPAVLLAGRQTAGRGRRGRVWASPPGNLYATLVWPDPDRRWPPSVLAAVQLACAEAVAEAGGLDARVKWPNDGWIGGRKWAGAVGEQATGPEGERLLVGLGANLVAAPAAAPGATALAEHWRSWPGDEAAARLLIGAVLGVLSAGPEALRGRLAGWPARDVYAPGEQVRIATAEGFVDGRYGGVDPDGRLVLATEAGERRLAAGDVARFGPA